MSSGMTRTIEIALSERYTAPEWAFLLQVRNGTGFTRVTRTADALAMSLYPSRGLHLHGFEIKASKSDWVKELKTPDKAEEIARFCHFWWIVAPKDVVPQEQLPVNWGLLELHAGKLKIAKAAVIRISEPITTEMLASIFRNVSTSMVPASFVQDRVDMAVRADRESRATRESRQIARLEERDQVYRDFEKESGIEVNRWDLGNIAKIVRMLQYSRDDPEFYRKHLEHVRDTVIMLGEQVNGALEGIGEMQSRIGELNTEAGVSA